jgi:hypothetical protein
MAVELPRLGATGKWEMFLVQVIHAQPQAMNKVAMKQAMLLVMVSPVYIKNNELTQWGNSYEQRGISCIVVVLDPLTKCLNSALK